MTAVKKNKLQWKSRGVQAYKIKVMSKQKRTTGKYVKDQTTTAENEKSRWKIQNAAEDEESVGSRQTEIAEERDALGTAATAAYASKLMAATNSGGGSPPNTPAVDSGDEYFCDACGLLMLGQCSRVDSPMTLHRQNGLH